MFTSLWPLGRSMPVRIYLIFQLWTLFCTFTDPFLSGYANTANSFLMDLNNGAKRSLKVLLSPGTHCNLGGDWELWVEAASFTYIYFRRTFIKLCYCIFRERHAKSSQLWWLGVWCLSHSNSVVLVWNTNEGNFAWFVCLFVCLIMTNHYLHKRNKQVWKVCDSAFIKVDISNWVELLSAWGSS